MEYLIYKSKALVAPGSTACRDIVKVSQRNNSDLGLTGFLHAEDGLFIQYLEGASGPLWALYEHLHLDLRHDNLELLGHGVLRKPRFAEWSMGYSEANVLSFDDFLEEVSFLDRADQTSGMAAIIFLMAASTRLDLGIAEPPQGAWR